MALYELVYTSTTSYPFTRSDIDDILESCRKNNTNDNITGVLVLNGNDVMQMLEGEEDDVRKLYAKIEADDRHKNCKVFWENHIESRGFSNWSMAYGDLKELKVTKLNTYSELIDEGIKNETSYIESAKKLLNSIRGTFLSDPV